jgi:acetylornithine deacetylase/succinyl-diaminopimelate desuccinylase-like protein
MIKVLSYFREYGRRFVDELCEYVSLASVSAQPKYTEDIQKTAAWLASHCSEIGLKAEILPTEGNPVVVARTPAPRANQHNALWGV